MDVAAGAARSCFTGPMEPPGSDAFPPAFHFPFHHFPFSCSLTSHPHASLSLSPFLSPSLTPPPPSKGGAAITEGGIDSFARNVVWAAVWHGQAAAALFFFPSPWAAARRRRLLTLLPSLAVCSSCVFKQANQHHSRTLARFPPPSPPPPSTI